MFDLLFPLLLAQEPQVPTQPATTDQKTLLLPHEAPSSDTPTAEDPDTLPEITAPRPAVAPMVVEYQPVLPLPGSLDQVPVFNSNSPEVISQEGILLSTFPRGSKASPNAHLELPLSGRFDIFTHHISRPSGEPKTLYQGLIVNNPTGQTRTLRVLQGLSYINSTDAPFRELLPMVEDPDGYVFSGPGSRLVGDLLRGKNQDTFPRLLRIPPYSTEILFSLPIPPSSARSTYLQVESDGGLYLANLAKYEVEDVIEPFAGVSFSVGKTPTGEAAPKPEPIKIRRSPTLDEWRRLLTSGRLVEPRDRAPVPTNDGSQIIYGRVAGVSVGSQWRAIVADTPNGANLTIPEPGESMSFPISTTTTGTFNTDQVHSAPMLVRYRDTALEGHGNYLVHYDLTFPLHNPTDETEQVSLIFQTPIKENKYNDRLLFFATPPEQIFFRGAVRVRYPNGSGQEVEDYFHLVQRRGEQGNPLVTLDIPAQSTTTAKIDFFYPPDATPPQVITVTTAPDTPGQ